MCASALQTWSIDRLEVTSEWEGAISSTPLCISSKNPPHRQFPPKACSLPWYHSSHTITEAIDGGDLIHTTASMVILAMTGGTYPLIAQEACHVTSLLQTGKMLVWEVKFFLPDTHRYGNACYVSVSTVYVLKHWRSYRRIWLYLCKKRKCKNNGFLGGIMHWTISWHFHFFMD